MRSDTNCDIIPVKTAFLSRLASSSNDLDEVGFLNFQYFQTEPPEYYRFNWTEILLMIISHPPWSQHLLCHTLGSDDWCAELRDMVHTRTIS